MIGFQGPRATGIASSAFQTEQQRRDEIERKKREEQQRNQMDYGEQGQRRQDDLAAQSKQKAYDQEIAQAHATSSNVDWRMGGGGMTASPKVPAPTNTGQLGAGSGTRIEDQGQRPTEMWDAQYEDALRAMLGGPRDTTAEEDLARQRQEAALGASMRDARARAGRAGMGMSGYASTLEGDLRRQGALAYGQEIADIQQGARDEALRNFQAAQGGFEGEANRQAGMRQGNLLALMLGKELGMEPDAIMNAMRGNYDGGAAADSGFYQPGVRDDGMADKTSDWGGPARPLDGEIPQAAWPAGASGPPTLFGAYDYNNWNGPGQPITDEQKRLITGG